MGPKVKPKTEFFEIPTPNPAPDKPHTFSYFLMIFLAIGIKTWQPLAIKASQQPDGTYLYNKTAMVILVELAKFTACAVIFVGVWYTTPPLRRPALMNLSFRASLHFIIPSALYAASNTLVYYSISYINPALFHVFGNIRILIAGVMNRVILGRKNTDVQWVALVFLTIGAMMASPEIGNPAIFAASSTFAGLVLIAIMSFCSTCSSIYTEITYKKSEELSIFYQNMVMYFYGILVNLVYLWVTDDGSIHSNGFLYGFEGPALVTLAVQSLMGIILSFLFKFLDNIVYVISLTVAMLLTAIVSILFYDFECSIPFICSMLLVNLAIYLFYRKKIIERFQWQEEKLNF